MSIINPNSISREEYLRRKRKKKLIKYYIFIFFIILTLSLLSYASYRPKVRINDVSLSGGVLITEKEIKEETLSYLKGTYFLLVPKNNFFVYPKKSLENHLADKFKRIETINISLDGLNKLKVEITERKPIALWCRVNPSTSTSTEETVTKESCYFIDSNSTVFALAPSFSGDAYFKYYGLIENENPIGAKYIASTTVFYNINKFIDNLKTLNIKPASLVSKGEGEYSVKLLSGGEIYIDSKKSLEESFGNLETLLTSPEFKNLNMSILPIEYIDLRYGNKLFYKLKI